MRKLSLLVSLGPLLFAPLCAIAQSAIDGTWKVDMSKVDFPKKPDVYLLQNGIYECKTCTPPIKVKTDGTDQPVTGHPYFDTVAIKVVNDHEIQETDKKGGKVVATSTTTASADGKTVNFTFKDSSNTNGGPAVTGKGEAELVTKGPSGSHVLSGSWRTTKIEGISDNAIVFTYKITGDSIAFSNPTGQAYTATLGGADAPMNGDPGVTSVSVKVIGKNVLEETDKRDGKAISVFKMTVAPDGKTAKATVEDMLQHRTTEFNVIKQ
jgi:hypothetical protein